MHLQDHDRRLKAVPIWKTLEVIRQTLGLDVPTFSNILEIPTNKYASMKGLGISPKASSIFLLSARINVAFESIMTGAIDLKAMNDQFHGNLSVLPDQYLDYSFSKKRNAINLLDYLEKKRGYLERALMLRNFQVTESLLKDPNEEINIKLGVDICKQLYRRFGANFITDMGSHAVATNKDSIIGKTISKAKTVFGTYEIMFDESVTKQVEKNFNWRIISANKSQCVIEGTPDPDILNYFGDGYIKSPVACMHRLGFLTSIPMYAGMKKSSVRKLDCICTGGASCIYEINFHPIYATDRFAS